MQVGTTGQPSTAAPFRNRFLTTTQNNRYDVSTETPLKKNLAIIPTIEDFHTVAGCHVCLILFS